MDGREVVEEAFSCGAGLVVAIGGELPLKSLFGVVEFSEDTVGGVGMGRRVEPVAKVGPTAELPGDTMYRMPVDFKGTSVGVGPPFPSLGSIVVDVAREVNEELSLPTSPPFV